MQKLDRGTSYQWRVRALNKAGKSQASHPSRGKEARPQNCELIFLNLAFLSAAKEASSHDCLEKLQYRVAHMLWEEIC